VELIPGGVGADGAVVDPLKVLQDGRADAAIAWLSGALVARRAGFDVVNIAQIFRRPATLLLCRHDASIRSAEHLRGKTVGVWNVGDEYDVAYWLRAHGLADAKVTLVQQRPNGLDLIENKVSCATASTYDEYWSIVTGGLAAASLTIFRLEERGEAFLEDGLYVPASALADPVKRDRLTRFLRASAAGWRYAADNPEDALAITLARTSNLDPTHQRRMLEAVLQLAEPARRFGLLDVGQFERSVEIVGLGVNDRNGIGTAANGAWTHRIWYAAGLDTADRGPLSWAVRYYLASSTDTT
jgi:NitT/TauT family transport system substrate-binding protein